MPVEGNLIVRYDLANLTPTGINRRLNEVVVLSRANHCIDKPCVSSFYFKIMLNMNRDAIHDVEISFRIIYCALVRVHIIQII